MQSEKKFLEAFLAKEGINKNRGLFPSGETYH